MNLILALLGILVLASDPLAASAGRAQAAAPSRSAPTEAAALTEGAIRAERTAPIGRGAAPHPSPRWSWPLSPIPAVVGAFDPPERKWLPGHRGVDLAASPGQPVLSPADGVVTFSGRVVHRGVITVTARTGERISFEPVVDQLARGRPVRRGEEIARRDPDLPHEPCGSCLHWGVRRGERYLHPLAYVRRLAPSVLLPPPRPASRPGPQAPTHPPDAAAPAAPSLRPPTSDRPTSRRTAPSGGSPAS
ncbi:M23 family metallopeptidase [Rothia halotolerans]|uniref:M23 family metallopeptidase n=1 Tax=Rothia halotolerans TaxID=405770 RepID=UPI00101B659D|nr:peptidoglycan DD-metalloendopeptidase family protein [Rothia halotolerans]